MKSRQQAILAAVIEKYVATAEPVGSGAIASDAALLAQFGALSPATVRSELAFLEGEGLLKQPHTSAGRVPTDAGYRFYVSEMIRPRRISRAEQTQLEVVAPPAASVEDAMQEAMIVLAKLTGYPAVASLPSGVRDNVRMLQLSPLPPRRLVLVLVTQAGRLEHRVFEIDDDVAPQTLHTVVQFLNENIGGQSLAGARSLDFENVAGGLHEAATINLARRAWEMVRDSVSDIADEKIVVQGLITLLDEPEFAEISQARAAMRLLDGGASLGELLRSAQQIAPDSPAANGVKIGAEMSDLPLDYAGARVLSFVGVSYGVAGETVGALGVLGPARMRYGDVLTIVPALAARLQLTLESF